MDLKIRKASSFDYNELKMLTMEVHNLHLFNRPDVYQDVDNPILQEYFEELLREENTAVFVVENSSVKELVAYSIVKFMNTPGIPVYIPKRFAHIDDFCVSEKYKRSGIGKMLFQYISEYVEAQGVKSIQLQVWEFNDNAIKFYEKLGMTTRNRKMEFTIRSINSSMEG